MTYAVDWALQKTIIYIYHRQMKVMTVVRKVPVERMETEDVHRVKMSLFLVSYV